MWQPLAHHVLSFLGGISASVLVRIDAFRALSIRRFASLIIIGCFAITVIAFPSAYGIMPLLLLSLIFSLIAGGSGVFAYLS